MTKLYTAVSEDIAAAAGGPMGSPTEVNWQRYFTSVALAKLACEKDYKQPIKWSRGKHPTCSGDLGHVMYTISPVKVESK